MKPVSTTNPKVQVTTVTSLDALEPYAKQWDQLALQVPQRLPMLSSAWVMAYLEHCLNPDEKWRCYLATSPDSRLIGILPIVIKPHPLWRSFFPILHTPWDWHTRSGDLLAESGIEQLILHAFLHALRKDFGYRFTLEMKGVRNNSPTLPALLNHSIPNWVSWIKLEPPGGFIPVDGQFEEFLNKFSSEFKSTLRRKGRRIAEMQGFALKFLVNFPSDFSYLDKFFELEASGWKGNQDTAIANSAKLKRFYCALTKKLAERSWLEVHCLEIENKLIASSLAVRFGAALVIPKLCYNETYSKFSPWNFLFERTIARAFEQSDCIEINMLSDSEWFNRWKMEWSDYYEVHLFPRHPMPIIFGKMPKVFRAKLSKIQWIRRLYPRLWPF